jgi:hypothetical protein
MKKPEESLFAIEFVKGGLRSNFVPKSGSNGARKVSDQPDEQVRLQVDSLVDHEVKNIIVNFFLRFIHDSRHKTGRRSEE